MTYLEIRERKYADLIVPMIGCPYGKATRKCPFVQYWQKYGFEQRINLIHTISANELEKLQANHRACVLHRNRMQMQNHKLSFMTFRNEIS